MEPKKTDTIGALWKQGTEAEVLPTGAAYELTTNELNTVGSVIENARRMPEQAVQQLLQAAELSKRSDNGAPSDQTEIFKLIASGASPEAHPYFTAVCETLRDEQANVVLSSVMQRIRQVQNTGGEMMAVSSMTQLDLAAAAKEGDKRLFAQILALLTGASIRTSALQGGDRSFVDLINLLSESVKK